ncbi:hypothetical protein G432_12285 [Sphingomonas sp. MM-1]|uniref:hypothetical protein n=1 Tax=Sphingomonas sp. MM-1 TaxID=745310 RepID=UPI0002C139DF|nr:hypothetical protein [Sphingomonas sp. MM-1]AGH50178.1 hypothetical protein G432_12285 [Sphingomonas sp. MM-1]
MSRNKITRANKPVSTALAIPTAAELVPIVGSERALAKLPGTGGAVAREDGTVLVTGRGYATRDGVIPAAEIYFVDGLRPAGEGVWLGEADKVAWRDETTGYECIMLRATRGGYLSGYVGVPRDHPLWGWEHGAVGPDLGVEVHGGLTYSRICEDGPSPERRLVEEARRICHVPTLPSQYEPVIHATGHRPGDVHAWWFGFDCNHAYDLVPEADRQPQPFLGAEVGAEYRDDAYVIQEILNLAAQLRAVADGVPAPPRQGPPLPPIGLDPHAGG